MSKKKDAKALRTSREFIAFAERNGCEVVHGKGSHVKARNAKGFAVIPNHPGDLATGTRKAIIKAFVAMGIAILALFAVLGMLV